jgi:hypothetical protein
MSDAQLSGRPTPEGGSDDDTGMDPHAGQSEPDPAAQTNQVAGETSSMDDAELLEDRVSSNHGYNGLEPAANVERAPTSLRVLARSLNPARLAETWAGMLLRDPLPTSVLSVLLPLLAIASGMGIAGLLGLGGGPKLLAILAGFGTVAAQYGGVVRLRRTTRKRSGIVLLVLVCTGWNAVSAAAGAAAWNADQLGRALIERSLGDVVRMADEAATSIAAVASKLDGLAAFSARQEAKELALRPNYAPTCPSSTGPGDGPVSRWRKESSADATTLANNLRQSSSQARAAATSAAAVAASYQVNDHERIVAAIGSKIAASQEAVGKADLSGIRAELARLQSKVIAGGLCPDPEMASLIHAADEAARNEIAVPQFKPPARPTEAEAVRDLFGQLRRLPGGTADLSLYQAYLIISLLADTFAMSMLGLVLGPKPKRGLLEDALQKIGPDIPAEELVEAYAVVQASPRWRAVEQRLERGRTWFRRGTTNLWVEPDETWLIFLLQRLGSRYLGPAAIVGGRIHYTLKPGILRGLFESLVDDQLRARGPATSEPSPGRPN